MLATVAFAALGGASLIAAAFDIAARRIPNGLNLMILLGGLGFLLTLPDVNSALLHLAHFGLALVVSMILFGLRLWGGGDAKLYSAVAVWFPIAQAPLLAINTALAGLALLIVVLLLSKFKARPELLRELPYGVAIGCGTLAVIALNLTG